MKPITENTIFYGDYLIILREHISTESIDHTQLVPFSIQTKIILYFRRLVWRFQIIKV
jgi:hypothetical protein